MDAAEPVRDIENGPLNNKQAVALYYASLGLSDAEIAREVGEGLRTVQGHVHAARVALKVKNRVLAFRRAAGLGYFDLQPEPPQNANTGQETANLEES